MLVPIDGPQAPPFTVGRSNRRRRALISAEQKIRRLTHNVLDPGYGKLWDLA